jgi:hypothetical protein
LPLAIQGAPLRAWSNIIAIYLFDVNSENFSLAKYIRKTKIVLVHRADCSNAAKWISPAVARPRRSECRDSLSMKGQ